MNKWKVSEINRRQKYINGKFLYLKKRDKNDGKSETENRKKLCRVSETEKGLRREKVSESERRQK